LNPILAESAPSRGALLYFCKDKKSERFSAQGGASLSRVGNFFGGGKVENNLVWIDMEMTGLDPSRDHVLEIALLVTDSHLNLIEEGPNLAVFQPDEVLQGMDDWNKSHHGASGLIDRVRASQDSVRSAEEKALAFAARFCHPKSSPLCGNSVWQDRRFLDRHMPELNRFFHYRIIDVSSIKELVLRWYPQLAPFKKKEQHLALADIRESVEELRYYRAHCFLPSA
jgi:oligoribonuclease